ncbi:hypothetical protein [Modestobacter sp. Leaf380]|uniref:hypothetical protein n=1 Tax=Modestobacter sp. Leaf380 TaxID=1736356 RepID=UPI0006FDCBF0|nr:hypothetical protein [Modestobacter sp. Leaf380]KQS73721.1 hypothetical protein ASG41_03780 [Modestobacter sp. Leaf380]
MTLLLPLGRLLTVLDLATPGHPDPRSAHGYVQVLGNPVGLSGAALHLWSACHGPFDAPGPWDRDHAATRAVAWGLDPADVAAGWTELDTGGLVVDLVDDVDGRRAWARSHTLHPLVPGLGEVPGAPGLHHLGLPGVPALPLVQVSRVLRDVCAWGPLFADVWADVDWHAAGYRDVGADEPRLTDPDLLLADLVASLPALLSTRAAHLDPSPTAGGAP